MGQDDSRIVRVLGELADLGRRIGERAEELATLAGKGRGDAAGEPGGMAASAAQLAASAADLAGATAPTGDRGPADRPRHAASSEPKPGRGTDRPAGQSAGGGSRRVTGSGRASSREAGATGSAAGSPSATQRKATRGAAAGSHVRPPRSPAAAGGQRRARPAGPVLVSTVMHLVVLLGLGMIFVARDAKPEKFVITSGGPEETVVEEFTPLEFEAAEAVDEAAEFTDLPPAEFEPVAAEPLSIDDLAAPTDLAVDAAAIMPASFSAADMLATVGGGDAGEASGGGGGGGRAGASAPGVPTFFGHKGQAQSVCFVCDNSGSYRDGGFHTVLAEVG
ncbi:MAG: hypothetical protein RLZZ440_1807, partial [Planctomycetota bacterium]